MTINALKVEYLIFPAFNSTTSPGLSGATYGAVVGLENTRKGIGEGPLAGQEGWGQYWALEIPLHKYYVEGLIPRTGILKVTAVAYDNSTIPSDSVSKVFHYVIPEKLDAPTISSDSSILQPVEQQANPTNSRTGYREYFVNVDEKMDTAKYYFHHGTGSSQYSLDGGIVTSATTATLYAQKSKVMKVVGSGTENGFKYNINMPVDENNSRFTMAIRGSGAYYIYLRVQSDVGIVYITYSSGYTGSTPSVSNGYLFMPTDHLTINGVNWTFVTFDLYSDLRQYYPNGNITVFEGLFFRGTAEIDDLTLNGQVLWDGETGSSAGWSVYDATPSGYSMSVVETDRLNKVTPASMTWSEVTSARVVDQFGLVKHQRMKLALDTTQLSSGTYILTVSALNNKGLSSTQSYWILVDHDAPIGHSVASIVPSANPSPNTYEYEVTVNAGSDMFGISNYRLYRDGNYVTQFTGTSKTITVSNANPSGSWKIVAVDYAGNQADSTNYVADNDYDNDGLTDYQEFVTYSTDPADSDTDNDDLSDGSEVNTYGTLPLDSDTDNDGLSDGREVTYGTLPLDSDTDNDGLFDGTEVNGWVSYDPTTDNLLRYTSSPFDADTDNDNYSDSQERNANTNPRDSDTDNDGLPDGWEASYSFDPLDPSNGASDPDSDGLNNRDEYLKGTHPRDSDTDNDGLPDGWEVTYGLNPKSASGADGANGDPDNDQMSNSYEYQIGTNPKVYNSRFSITQSTIRSSGNILAASVHYSALISGTLTLQVIKTSSSSGTSGTVKQTLSWSIGIGSGSKSIGYTMSSTGYYRVKITFKTTSGSTLFSSFISGYVYYSGGGGSPGPTPVPQLI